MSPWPGAAEISSGSRGQGLLRSVHDYIIHDRCWGTVKVKGGSFLSTPAWRV